VFLLEERTQTVNNLPSSTFDLKTLVYEHLPMDAESRAFAIRQAIEEVGEREQETEELREQVADLEEAAERDLGKRKDRIDELKETLALRDATIIDLEKQLEAAAKHASDNPQHEATRDALRDLIAAIEGVRVGKSMRVGNLIVVGPDRDFASLLAGALEAAKAAL
jgi:chromosome segregation ATPase